MKNPPEKTYREGEILVKFKKDVSQDRIGEILEETGTEKIKMLGTVGVYVLRIPKGTTVESMVEKFQTLPEVEYAEPNYTVTIRRK